MAQPRTILFLIRSLSTGGAERQLVALANGLAERGHKVSVAVFYGGGDLERDLRGARLHDLGKAGRWDLPAFFLRLVRLIRKLRPDVLHGYLGTANLLSVLARPFAQRMRVVWGLRASDMDLARYDWVWRLSARLEVLASRFADRIIVNSRAGRDHAVRQGMPAKRLVIIPNGIDTDRYRPDSMAGRAVRGEWGVPDGALLVGHVGRLDPMKDHETFLRAAALLAGQRTDARFVCVGGGDPAEARRLEGLAADLGLADRLVWAGARQDMPAVYNALDVLCLSSAFGEGFPNVLGEAMSCGVPCVATDVGDAALVMGDTGIVVPRRDHAALAAGLRARLERPDENLRAACRARILAEFGLERMVMETEALLLGIARPQTGRN